MGTYRAHGHRSCEGGGGDGAAAGSAGRHAKHKPQSCTVDSDGGRTGAASAQHAAGTPPHAATRPPGSSASPSAPPAACATRRSAATATGSANGESAANGSFSTADRRPCPPLWANCATAGGPCAARKLHRPCSASASSTRSGAASAAPRARRRNAPASRTRLCTAAGGGSAADASAAAGAGASGSAGANPSGPRSASDHGGGGKPGTASEAASDRWRGTCHALSLTHCSRHARTTAQSGLASKALASRPRHARSAAGRAADSPAAASASRSRGRRASVRQQFASNPSSAAKARLAGTGCPCATMRLSATNASVGSPARSAVYAVLSAAHTSSRALNLEDAWCAAAPPSAGPSYACVDMDRHSACSEGLLKNTMGTAVGAALGRCDPGYAMFGRPRVPGLLC